MKTKLIKGAVDILIVDGVDETATDIKLYSDDNWQFLSTIKDLTEVTHYQPIIKPEKPIY